MHVFDQPIVFVDIETTGLSPMRNRVIEVAALRVENGEVTQEFSKIINPECEIPYFIENLTGIRDADARKAPLFAEIAQPLHDILSDAIFVAHNVKFDYAFLRHEFSMADKKFQPNLFCTMQLSRALYPHLKSHKLEHIIERHGLTYQARHRAYDDAHALWQFVQHAQKTFSAQELQAAIKRQLPALV